MKASEIMTREVVTVRPDTPVREIARLLNRGDISGVPVVDEAGAVVGIITESDLFRALCSMLGIGEPSARIVLTLPDDKDLLRNIDSRIEGMQLRSMAMYRNALEKSWEVALRVRSSGK